MYRRFPLRMLFAVVTGCAVVLAACSGVAWFIEREWNEPARVGQAADARFQALFARRGWAGYEAAFFYDGRVRIVSPSIGDQELPELVPILRQIPWLRHIELFETTVTARGLAHVQRQFPHCHISNHKRP